MTLDDRFLKKEYLKNLFPIMFSVLGGTINALIDGALVSQKIGSSGLASVNMSMPVYLVICTIGALISSGASLYSAQAAGNQRMEDARRYFHTALLLAVLTGFVVLIVGTVLCRPISVVLAQNGDLTEYVYIYSLVTILGAIPSILVYIPLSYLHLEGKTHEISVMMTVMIVSDVVLDILLMYVLGLDLLGAALASVAATVIACIFGFVMLERGYSNYHISRNMAGFHGWREIVRLGSPAALGNLMDAVKLFILNAIIFSVGGTGAAAVWAVLNSLSEFAMCITSGVPQAATPMTGAYFAARENSGLRILVSLQVKVGLILSGIFSLVLLLLHRLIEILFVVGEDMRLPLLCLGIYFLFDLICNCWITFFNSTGRIAVSNFLVVCRKLLFSIAAAMVLVLAHGYLWAFLPIGSVFTLVAGIIVTGIYASRYKGKYPLSKILLLDDSLEIDKNVLDFSITPDPESICSASEQIKDFCEVNEMNLKQTMRLGLAIEELLGVIVQKNEGLKSVDLRAFAFENTIGIRVRCAGKRYDPFSDKAEDDFLMGIDMIRKMAQSVNYTYSLGMNVINISFERKG